MKVQVCEDKVLMVFEGKTADLKMALETMYMIRDNCNTDALDKCIIAVQNALTPPPPIMRICEMCWCPINPHTHLYHTIDGKYVHEKCPT